MTLLVRPRPQSDFDTMTDTTKEAERLFKPQAEAHAASEYEREQQKIRANLERLKAERLAREAAGHDPDGGGAAGDAV
jgi:hypothetical protein